MKLRNGMILLIDKAQKDDAKQVINYLNIVGGESDNLLFGANEFTMSVEEEENFIGNLEQSKSSALLVGKIEDEIVCFGSVMASSRERISHQSDLAVTVKKKYWGLGIGTFLMQALIEYAKQSEKTEILHLGVKCDNENAINLYKKMGFEEMGRYKRFFKIGEEYYDEILMNLYLGDEGKFN